LTTTKKNDDKLWRCITLIPTQNCQAAAAKQKLETRKRKARLWELREGKVGRGNERRSEKKNALEKKAYYHELAPHGCVSSSFH
jgi:hypothetical protein